MCVCEHESLSKPSVLRFGGQPKLCQQTFTQAHFLQKSSVPWPLVCHHELYHTIRTEANVKWLSLVRILQYSSQRGMKFHPQCHVVTIGLTMTLTGPRTRAQMKPLPAMSKHSKVTIKTHPGPGPRSCLGPHGVFPKAHLLDLEAKQALLSPH